MLFGNHINKTEESFGQEKKHIDWIDGVKFVAMMAVLVDHTTGILHNNRFLTLLSFASVSIFMLLSGITAWYSEEKGRSFFGKYINSIKKVIIMYIIATLFYHIAEDKEFELRSFLSYIVRFNASLPFYYVLLYIQVILFKNPFKTIITNCKSGSNGLVIEVLILGVISIISWITTNYTNILGIYGGGGKLFGGTFLVLFYMGMLLEAYGWLNQRKRCEIYFSILVGTITWCLWIYWNYKDIGSIEEYLVNIKGVNPPGIVIMVSAFLLLMIIGGIFTVLLEARGLLIRKITKFISYLGRYSFSIFLFHSLWMKYLLNPYLKIDNIWVKRVVYIVVIVFGSIWIEKLINRCLYYMRKIVIRESSRN